MDINSELVDKLLRIGLVIIAAMVVQLIGRGLIERVVRRVVRADRYESKLDERKREDTIISIFHTSFLFFVITVTLLVILAILNVNVGALVAGAGLFGVVIGLGAQSTIKDYLAGMFILTENQYRVGDVVTLSGGSTTAIGTSGVVEEITLRITKLRDLDGTMNIVRNGEAGIVTNRTFKYGKVVVDITFSYETNIDKAEAMINRVGVEMLSDEYFGKLITEPVVYLRVDSFNDAGVVVKCVGKVKPASQWEVAGDFRRRIKTAMESSDIHFGLQQRVLHETVTSKSQK